MNEFVEIIKNGSRLDKCHRVLIHGEEVGTITARQHYCHKFTPITGSSVPEFYAPRLGDMEERLNEFASKGTISNPNYMDKLLNNTSRRQWAACPGCPPDDRF